MSNKKNQKIASEKEIGQKKNLKSENKEKKALGENIMRKAEIEKVVLSCGGVGDKLEKSMKLLGLLSGKKVKKVASTKRVPAFGVRPGLEIGCVVTIRGKEKEEILKRLLEAIDRKIKKKQIKRNGFSFGIREYLEIPGMEYQRDIGILGLNVTIVFRRKGKRISFRKIKRGRLPEKQHVTAEEIIDFLINKFNVEVGGK